jgi:hypothetical protein
MRRALFALSLSFGMVALVASGTQAADPPARALVPNPSADLALGGDGQEPSVTAEGASSTYRNPGLGGTNLVYVAMDTTFGRFQLIIDDRAPANRRLYLDIKTPSPITYQCVKGPEDPNQASNRNHPRLGAQISVSGGKAQLLCFDQTGTQGYMVYTPYVCVTLTAVGAPVPPDPSLTTHYVIDGRGCEAYVYTLSKNQLTPIRVGGKNSAIKEFDFPIYLEADA